MKNEYNYLTNKTGVLHLRRRRQSCRRARGVQPYKFGGKELDRSYGLDAYDFEARPYHPVLMRFTGFDPLASKYPAISPFAYCANNPVNRIDPMGLDWYEAENGNVIWRRSQDKEYTDENGNVYKNIGTEYLVGGTLFQQHTNEEGGLYLRSTTDEKEVGRYIGRKLNEGKDQSGRIDNVSPEFAILMGGTRVGFAALKWVWNQISSPIMCTTNTSDATKSNLVQFGKDSNQQYHTFRHADEIGLDKKLVENAVRTDLQTTSSLIVVGKPFNQTITVSGVKLQYTTYK